MDPNSRDPEAGAQDYVHNIMKGLRHVGAAQLLKDKNQAKNVTSKRMQGLKPREVK